MTLAYWEERGFTHYCLICIYGLFSVKMFIFLAGPCILILINHHNYFQSDTEIVVFRCSDTPSALYFFFVKIIFPLTANSFEGFFPGKTGKASVLFPQHNLIKQRFPWRPFPPDAVCQSSLCLISHEQRPRSIHLLFGMGNHQAQGLKRETCHSHITS